MMLNALFRSVYGISLLQMQLRQTTLPDWEPHPDLESVESPSTLADAAAEADHYRSTIQSLISQIRQRYNCRELRDLRFNIDRLEEYNLHKLALLNAEIRKNYSIFLEIGEMERLATDLNDFFIQVMRNTPDRRVEDLYEMFQIIRERIMRLGIPVGRPGSIHRRGKTPRTRVNGLELAHNKVKQEKQKRLKLEKQKDMLIEGTQQMISQREKTLRKLLEENAVLREKISEHSKDLQQRDDNIAECMRTIDKLRKSLCQIQFEPPPTPPPQPPTIVKVETENLAQKIQASVSSAIQKALKQQQKQIDSPSIRISPPPKTYHRQRFSESANPENILSPHESQREFNAPFQERTNNDLMRMMLLQAATIEQFLVCNQID